MNSRLIRSLFFLSCFTVAHTSVMASSTNPFSEFKDPKNPVCKTLDLFLKKNMELKSNLIKGLESGDTTWRETAEELFPLAIKKTPRSEIFERCGTEGYELYESLSELLEKTPTERKEEKPLLIEKLGDWKSCLNEMTKSQLVAETKTVLACYEKLVESL